MWAVGWIAKGNPTAQVEVFIEEVSKPLEAQRLSELNERFIKDIYRLMTRYLQDKM